MLKRMFSKKMIVSTAVLFALLLVCLMPKESLYTLDNIKEELSYVDRNASTSIIYLYDKSDLLARTSIQIDGTKIEDKAKNLITALIKESALTDKIPSGFKQVLPASTKILSIGLEDKTLKINFSGDLLNVSAKEEEHVIEALVYTLTNIDGVDNIILYIDGDILTSLPQSKKNLPATLNRAYGINKQYDLTSFKDVMGVTVYYVGKYNDDYYYVPVTKYLNSSKDKIKVIIEELASGPSYGSNLMSFLNSNTKLLATEQDVNTMHLVFNNYIFSDMSEENILEEVLYTINLSIADNYDVEEVIFEVENKEIYKSVLKSIEKIKKILYNLNVR